MVTHPGILTVIFAAMLGIVGPVLDDHSAVEQRRFEQAAQQLCGPQAAWQQQADGSVSCRTTYGRPTITVRVSP